MAWYPKPATGTSVRNKSCPYRNDTLATGLAMDEGTGTALTDLGKQTSAPYNAITMVNTPTWGTETGIGDCLVFASGASQRIDLFAASGSNISLPRWTIAFWIKPESTTATARNWLSSGTATGTEGQLRIIRNASTGVVTAFHYSTASTPQWSFSGISASAIYYVVVSGGEQGFSVRLFGASGEIVGTPTNNPQNDTAPLVILDGQTLSLLSNGGVGVASTYEYGRLFGYQRWYWQLSNREIEQLAVDPAVWSRPIPTALTDLNNCMVGRVTTSAAYFGGLVTAPGLSGTCYMRVQAAASLDTMISSPDVVNNVNTSTAAATLGMALSDIGNGRYWVCSVSSDGTTYRPLPGGMGHFSKFPATGTNFKWGKLTDDHFNDNAKSGGYFTDATGPNLRYSYAVEDVFQSDLTFLLLGGDMSYRDALGDDYEGWVAWRNFINPMTQTCCCFLQIGNHDGEGGYLQQSAESSTAGNQRQSTILRKKFWVNPKNDTYPLGGENDTEYLDEAGSDWVPALDGTFDATYRTNQIGDGTDGNGPPLENYYVVSCGDLDLFVGDLERASSVGITLEVTVSPPWEFGTKQKAFFEAAAAASTAVNKMFSVHKTPGGVRSQATATRWYGRDTGGQVGRGRLISTGINYTAFERANLGSFEPGEGIPEELWLHDFLRTYGFRGRVKGHDHKWTHYRKQTVNYINAPTPQDENHFNTTDDQIDVFGNYRVDYSDRAGDGYLAGRPGYGYLVFSVTPTGMGYFYRKTFVNTGHGVDTKDNTGTQFRDLGPLLTGTDGAITLDEAPRMVLCVAAEADGYWDATTVANIETSFATYNRYTEPHTGAGASAFDEPYATGAIVYDDTGLAAGSQSIYVEYAPRSIGLNGTATPIPLLAASNNTGSRRAMLGVGR